MKITIPDSVLSTELRNEAVLLNLETGEYFGLNEVGMGMWKLLRDGKDLAEATLVLLQQYDVSEDVLTKDLQALVQQLAERKLVLTQP